MQLGAKGVAIASAVANNKIQKKLEGVDING